MEQKPQKLFYKLPEMKFPKKTIFTLTLLSLVVPAWGLIMSVGYLFWTHWKFLIVIPLFFGYISIETPEQQCEEIMWFWHNHYKYEICYHPDSTYTPYVEQHIIKWKEHHGYSTDIHSTQ